MVEKRGTRLLERDLEINAFCIYDWERSLSGTLEKQLLQFMITRHAVLRET